MHPPKPSIHSLGSVLLCAAAIGGCFENERVLETHPDAGSSGLPLAPPGLCTRGKHCIGAERGTDKVDLLFMIDNSNSMREEQAALLAQIPMLIEALSTGDIDGDGTPEFGAVRDLHLGAVSSDMGIVGIQGVDNCNGLGGDGLLEHQPRGLVADCKDSYPTFLSYKAAGDETPKDIAHEFACIATLGTGGCGFEQQLEAPLKALWPADKPLPDVKGSSPEFLAFADGTGARGHGDRENAGFLRSDASGGGSVLGVMLITDEEDGSSSNTHHFTPPTYLDPNDPLVNEPLNLRDFHHPEELFPVQRYVEGFRALRPDHENMVVFGAITGVPPDLVGANALAKADGDKRAREAFYDEILDDDRMKERIDPASMTTPGTGNLFPACETAHGKAYPARRIVETARGFGDNGFVQSICEDDYRAAVRELAQRICKHVATGCIAESIGRDADGGIACDLLVVLANDGATRDCKDLGRGANDAGMTGEAGAKARQVCNITQAIGTVSADDDDAGSDPSDELSYWYYDDSSKAAAQCGTHARVGLFGIDLPHDAELFLDCK